MARKQRPSHLHDPPAVSSPTEEEEEETLSDDEEGEQEEDEEGVGKPEEGEQSSSEEEAEAEGEQSSSEEEAEAAKIESLPVKPHSETKPMEPESTEEEEEEEEEETLSDDEEGEQEEDEGGVGEQEEDEEEGEQSSSEEEAEAAIIESLPVKSHSETKPMEPESTPVEATQARTTRSSTMKKKKRPNSETETTPSKRVKKKDPDPEPKSQGGGGGEEKKLFQRLWSSDNEMELLQGMLEFKAAHDSDPAAHASAFYEFIKNSLPLEVSKAKLVDKMKRLRKKYRNNAGRGKKGKDPTFSKPHERNTYELSKKIWGCSAADGVSCRCLNGMLSFSKNNVVLEESLIKKGLELIGQQKRLELEERWKRVELAKLQVYATQTELVRDQTNLILEALKGHSEVG